MENRERPASLRPGGPRLAQGYTLIEFAIILTVAGIMIGAFSAAYNIYNRTQQAQLTENNATAVIGAISNYLIQNGAYPCPARLNAQRTDPDYGLAGQCDNTQASYPCPASAGLSVCTPGALAAGTCSYGYCEENSDRLPALAQPLVRRGMVPFRTLGLPEDMAEDGYRIRFQYAVTEALAVPVTYNITHGGIDVVNELYVTGSGIPAAGTEWIAPPAYDTSPFTPTTGGSAHYVLFSSGPDRAGGYTRYGQQMTPCPTGTLDAENCNTSPTSPYAIYRLAPYSTTAGANHFDDMVKYFSTVELPLWKVSTNTGYHITDLLNTTTGQVGIGTPNPGATLEVAGQVHAKNDLHAVQMCPAGTTASGCFPIAHSQACPTGQYATDVGPAVGSITCSAGQAVVCPPGELMVGVNPQDHLRCTSNTNCPVKNLSLCGSSVDIPASANGTIWTSPVEGTSYQETWTCNDGTWSLTSSTGVCACTAGSTSTTMTCADYYGYGAGTYSGNMTTTTTTTCPAGTETTTADTSACVCTNTSQMQTVNCDPGFTGGPLTQTNTWTCSGGSGSWTGWTTTAGTCTCDPTATDTQALSCPAGYSGGSITQTSTMQCPAGTWGPWVTTSNTCTCMNPPARQYQTIGCPSPQLGTQDQVSIFDCTSGTWGPWTTYQNNCGTVTYIWQAISNATGPYPGPLSITLGATCATAGATSSCSSAAGGGQYWHYDTCQCE